MTKRTPLSNAIIAEKVSNNGDDFLEKLRACIRDILITPGAQTTLKHASTEAIKDLEERVSTFERIKGEMQIKMTAIEQVNRQLTIEVKRLRRNNTLRIIGLPEAPNKDTTANVINFVSNKLGVKAEKSDIKTAFTIGKLVDDKAPPRPSLLVKFNNKSRKKEVYDTRIKLKDR